MPRDYYEILGVARNASQDEIKAAFRRLARQYHPDVSNEPNAEERFKEINEAYAVLSDPQKRTAYDRFGHAGVGSGAGGFGGTGDFGMGDFADLFEEIFGFGGFARAWGQTTRQRPRRGRDLQISLTLEFEEAVFGAEKEVRFTRNETCHTCQGTGAAPGTQPQTCQTCRGSGRVRQTRTTFFGTMVQETACPTCNGRGEIITKPCPTCNGRGIERRTVHKVVKVPPGVDTGTQIRMAGEGEPGEHGGPAGDLYIKIKVKPHRYFQRKGDDIILNLNINIAQAALGAEVTVPTVDGETSLRIPAGTQPGQTFRLRGKGVPRLQRNGRGDQIVIVNIEIPKHLNAQQRELMEALAESLGTEVKPQERSILDKLKDLLG